MADVGQLAASASRATWIHQSCSSSKLERSLVGSAPEKEETRSPSLWNVKVGCADGNSENLTQYGNTTTPHVVGHGRAVGSRAWLRTTVLTHASATLSAISSRSISTR
jgi:hypothetical protein